MNNQFACSKCFIFIAFHCSLSAIDAFYLDNIETFTILTQVLQYISVVSATRLKNHHMLVRPQDTQAHTIIPQNTQRILGTIFLPLILIQLRNVNVVLYQATNILTLIELLPIIQFMTLPTPKLPTQTFPAAKLIQNSLCNPMTQLKITSPLFTSQTLIIPR